jgi:hypothetical protein
MEFITERPEGMEFNLYKIWMKAQTKSIKNYLKGKYIFESKTAQNKLMGIKGKTYIKEKV